MDQPRHLDAHRPRSFCALQFCLNVTLARWMSVEDYGAFAIAFSIFLVIAAAQSSLVIGPLLVFGPNRYRDSYAAYLGLLIKGQMALSLLVSIGLALAGAGFLLWGSHEIGEVLFALAAAGPFILQLWLLRQSGYVQLQAKRAAGAGAVYLGLVLAGTFVLYRLEVLSPTTALISDGSCEPSRRNLVGDPTAPEVRRKLIWSLFA